MANGAKLAYVRVSTEEQNEARQVEALKQYDIDKWFIEKVSGKDMNRRSCGKCWTMPERAIQSTSTTFPYQPKRC